MKVLETSESASLRLNYNEKGRRIDITKLLALTSKQRFYFCKTEIFQRIRGKKGAQNNDQHTSFHVR